MKRLFLMLAIALFLTSSYAQILTVNDVPATVTKSFKKTHPKVDTVQWSKTGDVYKASYDLKMKDMSATYTAAGKLQQTEAEITVASLPTAALKYLNENYPADVVKSSSKVTSAKGKVTYAVKIKGMDLTFSSTGKIIT